MKKMKLILTAAMLITSAAFAHDDEPGVIAISKATELGVHRIERLVTLKKIDPAFRDHLSGLRAERSTENGATFKVHGYVASGADTSALTISLWMDVRGKTLAYNVTPGKKPENPFAWPQKDAATLMEEGLHFVIEGWAQHPEVKAFYTGLQTVTLSPAQAADGSLIAQFRVTSDDDARTLTINLRPDGSYISHDLR